MITAPRSIAETGTRNDAVQEKKMAIAQELLDILVCPLCKTPVKYTPDQAGLQCATCRRTYPVRDDIPVMLLEEARVESKS